MKRVLLVAALAFAAKISLAEDFPFGKPTATELELKKYEKDSSANAVVLREFGTAQISSRDGNLIFKYHVRIKLFNSKGFKHGNITIPLYKNSSDVFESISDIKGITFYPDENDLIHSSELDPKQIFKEKSAGKYLDLVKFAMPNLKDGTIIEYSYEINSPFFVNFKKWDFQWDIPKIYSEYNPHVPACYNYNIALRGLIKLTKNTSTLEKNCFTPDGGFKADCTDFTFIMENVPAFQEEEYMTSANNFKSALTFELTDWVDRYGHKHKHAREWKDVDQKLKTDESFGIQLKKKEHFAEKITATIAGKTSELEKAKAIFSYWQKWFKWNGYLGIYSSDGIKKAFENHTGSIADINLSLVTAMNSAGLKAEPVISSTRNNGLVNTLFPSLDDFDYVLCRVTIGEKAYLLDASDPLLPFGLLPLKCINGQGRVMVIGKESFWMELNASQKESRTVNLDLTISETGKAKGSMVIFSAGYEALQKRSKIKSFNSIEEFVENIDESMPKVKFLKSAITNLDSLDNTLVEEYTIEIDAAGKLEKDKFYINPFFLEKIKENPFKLAERLYPIDWGAPSETRIALSLTFPEKFELITKPDNVGLAIPNNGGRFISQISVEGNTLTFMNQTQLSKSVYNSEEYPFIKELYNKIIQSQQVDIVFKKKI